MKISAGIATALVVLAAGCGNEVDPTPEKLDGTPSQEFEQEDLDAAEGHPRVRMAVYYQSA